MSEKKRDFRTRYWLPVNEQQERCPRCGWMYCEGFWAEGVCRADMYFGPEPTAAGDAAAAYLRAWYERHRESSWERSRLNPSGRSWEWASDELMLGLINEMGRIADQRSREEEKRKKTSGDA